MCDLGLLPKEVTTKVRRPYRCKWHGVWAALIALPTGIGFASLMLGLVIVLPLSGHATYYAYRDLVR